MLVFLSVCSMLVADGPYAKLKEKGLKASAGYYVVEEENELAKGLADMRSLERTLNTTTRAYRQLDEDIKNAKETVRKLLSENKSLRTQLDRAAANNDAFTNNRLINAINQNVEEINRLNGLLNDNDTGKDVREKFSKARDAYLNKLLALRSALERAKKKYEDLTKDQAISDLVPKANEEIEKEYELGPSKMFERNEASLKKMESRIQSDKIVLRKQANTFLIDVVLNGKLSKSMVFDTGASAISLPEAVANELGLSIGSDDEKVRVSIANGDVVIATRKTLESVRVGKFEANNVECLVMPASMRDAPMLLGGAFLNNFNYRMDPNTGELTLGSVDLGGEPKSKKTTKKPAKRKP